MYLRGVVVGVFIRNFLVSYLLVYLCMRMCSFQSSRVKVVEYLSFSSSLGTRSAAKILAQLLERRTLTIYVTTLPNWVNV